jgi:hypothetical protein
MNTGHQQRRLSTEAGQSHEEKLEPIGTAFGRRAAKAAMSSKFVLSHLFRVTCVGIELFRTGA